MRAREDGWSFVELLAAVTITMIGLVALMKGFFGGSRLAEEARETNLLNAACRSAVEAVRAAPFSAIVSQYGPGSGKDRFWCGPEGATTYSAIKDPFAQGRVQLFTNESAIPSSFGLSARFDLNANGSMETGPVTDYKILPVRVTCDLARARRPRTVTVEVILSEGN